MKWNMVIFNDFREKRIKTKNQGKKFTISFVY
nr:MAG TPA: hypothetical protein [Caudoviricetes sp.]